jgi:hypothetical protein
MNWTPNSFLDVVQTVALVAMNGVLIYAVWMVGRLVKAGLWTVLRDNERLSKQVAIMINRLEALEQRERGR